MLLILIMMIILNLPVELLYHIVDQIIDPKSFINLALSNKLFSSIVNDPIIQRKAKNRMIRKIENIDEREIKKIYYILPNGKKEGNNSEAISYAKTALSLYPNDKNLIEYMNSLNNSSTTSATPATNKPKQ